MSKKKVLLFAFIILVVAASLIILFNNSTYYYIDQVNSHLNAGEFKLLAKAEELKKILESFTEEPGFGGTSYIDENKGLRISFSGFPDVTTPGYSITGIELRSPNYSIYDIRVGDSIDKAADILKRNGYRISDSEYKYSILFIKDKILINFQSNEKSEIVKININLQSTNKQNVVF